MAHLVGDIAKYFKINEIDIDNLVFKLFYQGCVILFFVGSLVCVTTQYIGDPINCDFKALDGDMATQYCWIHGSSYIPEPYREHMKCIIDMDGIENEDDTPETSYYQWVPFVLLIQAGLFRLPYELWKILEGGLMNSFGTSGKSAVLLSADAEYDDGDVMEAVVEKFVKYYRSTFHHNQMYFVYFVVCEGMNIIMLFLNFSCTDKFLNGNFIKYGWKAIGYYTLSTAEQKVVPNPFCTVFPTEVSCNVPNIGAAGGGQTHNGLCVLSQNIINQKMYLLIWFWMCMLICISVPYFIFRLCTIFFEKVRYALIASKCGKVNDPEVGNSIRYIMQEAYGGDWFVLHQLSKNVNKYFFREFLKELRRELKAKPKHVHGRPTQTILRKKSSDKKEEQVKMNHMPTASNHSPPTRLKVKNADNSTQRGPRRPSIDAAKRSIDEVNEDQALTKDNDYQV